VFPSVTQDDFDVQVIERSHVVTVAVVFSAEWCEPCHDLLQQLEQEAMSYVGLMDFVVVDFNGNPKLTKRLHVWALPSVRVFKCGKAVGKFTGAKSRRRLSEFLRSVA